MSTLTLTYDIMRSIVNFSKEHREYSVDFVDLKTAIIPEKIILKNRPGNFDLLFENRKTIWRGEFTRCYEYYLDDPRCIVFRLYL